MRAAVAWAPKARSAKLGTLAFSLQVFLFSSSLSVLPGDLQSSPPRPRTCRHLEAQRSRYCRGRLGLHQQLSSRPEPYRQHATPYRPAARSRGVLLFERPVEISCAGNAWHSHLPSSKEAALTCRRR
ncbi:hypothetical protein DFH11DRAFT_1629207 [Phellopilus nigrolimitatus]|nr:hypothetical protein DFH11DRAFT_1629207 [Phellopilus nigrolimitatus]